MAEGGYDRYDLSYFTGDVTFSNSEHFRDSDKDRFFQFNPQDSLTTVAISKLHYSLGWRFYSPY